MSMYVLLSFFSALFITLLLTPAAIRLAVVHGVLDQPGGRKVHSAPVPRWGGIGVFGGFISTLAALCLMGAPEYTCVFSSPSFVLLLGALSIHLLGIQDDRKALPPSAKLVVQVLAATGMAVAGIRIDVIGSPIDGNPISLGWLSYPVTVVWIVGITNAVNLIDGLDGLAAGTGMIASLVIGVTALLRHEPFVAMMAFALGGSLLGFLRFNFFPARVFLGDSGSLFVGFMLSVLSILGLSKGTATFAIGTTFLAIGFPILDTLLCILRRPLRAAIDPRSEGRSLLNAIQQIVRPDRDHIHHRVISLGLSHRSAVLLLYGVSTMFGLGALAITMGTRTERVLAILVVLLAMGVFVRALRYRELSILRNGLLLRLYDHPIFGSRGFHLFLDAGLAAAAVIVAANISGKATSVPAFVTALSLGVFLQILSFVILGIYRHSIKNPDASDLGTVILGSFAGSTLLFVLLNIFGPINQETLLALTLQALLLIVVALLPRISYRILARFTLVRSGALPHVLIYGTGPDALAALTGITSLPHYHGTAVGFIDEDGSREGTVLNGHPVFGGHWKVPRLLQTLHVDEIIVADPTISPEIFKRLQRESRLARIPLKGVTPADQPTTPVAAPAGLTLEKSRSIAPTMVPGSGSDVLMKLR